MPTVPNRLPPEVNPLAQEHCDILCEILQSCKNTEQLAEACEACNLDVAAARQKNAEQSNIAQLIKSTFFPDRP